MSKNTRFWVIWFAMVLLIIGLFILLFFKPVPKPPAITGVRIHKVGKSWLVVTEFEYGSDVSAVFRDVDKAQDFLLAVAEEGDL